MAGAPSSTMTTSVLSSSSSSNSTSPKSSSPTGSVGQFSSNGSHGYFQPMSSGSSGATSSSYFPSFPIRNKSRTPSVSSTSTITSPIHNLLQTSSGILLPKRQATTSSSSTTSAALTLASPALSASSSSSSLDQSYRDRDPHINNMNSSSTNMVNGRTTTTTTAATTTTSSSSQPASTPILVLEPLNETFALKSLDLPEHSRVKIGRQTGVTTAPNPTNGYFDSKVLSRVHAEVWSENGKVFIRDLKSSNGTFLNGKRLCPENVESEPFILNQGDSLEFGIDILDENGLLLHEKVACKIYISRMSYPTPGGSPQEAHAKLKNGSPSGSGSNSFKTNSGSSSGSGLSANIDLIISRLQNELTRSQETNGDLGALKHGLGELEKAFIVNGKDAKSKTTESNQTDVSAQVAAALAASAADHERKLEQIQQTHSAEIQKLMTTIKETKEELGAFVQRTELLEPLVAQDEILRSKLAQSTLDLNTAKTERDTAKDNVNKLINEHQQAMENLRKEQEVALAILEDAHKTALAQVAAESVLAQETMVLKHEQELEQITAALTKQYEETIQTTSSTAALEIEVKLKSQLESLQQSIDVQTKEVEELKTEKAVLQKKLEDTLEDLSRIEQELKRKESEQKQERERSEDLSSLTPTSTSSPSSTSTTTTTTKRIVKSSLSTSESDSSSSSPSSSSSSSSSSTTEEGSVTNKYEFSWSQFVFPMAKKNHSHPHQPPTIFLSGGFMLVGLGAYVLWHKAGLVSN
ncbi:hypothetical protein BG004_007756 [Podila humilis]|nr:hypothetical protein BG004_007756 [Podila humilis]